MLKRLGMDGDKWAREFIKMFENGDIKDIDLDLMRAWFCNSIMAGYDRGWYDALHENDGVERHQNKILADKGGLKRLTKTSVIDKAEVPGSVDNTNDVNQKGDEVAKCH